MSHNRILDKIRGVKRTEISEARISGIFGNRNESSDDVK
jgi:hypothetical protein